MKKTSLMACGALASVGFLAERAEASGFQLFEQGASGLGRAYSGEAVVADDASIIASNPAGSILLDGTNASVALHLVMPNLSVNGTLGGALPVGDDDAGQDALIPALYVTSALREGLSAGLGVYTRFGLETDYGSGLGAGLQIADKSAITTIDINPSIAVRFRENVTLGFGLDVVYADAELASSNGPANVLTLEGDDVAVGFSLGLLVDVTEDTRVGVAYKSAIDMSLSGDVTSDVFTGTSATMPDFRGPGGVGLTLPDSFEVSVAHDVSDTLTVHADATRSGWGSFDQIAPVLDNGTPLPPTPQNWESTWRYSLGVTAAVSDALTLRAGVSFDETPTNDADRTLRIPDGDRIWLAAGARYDVNDAMSVDLGYAYIMVDDAEISDTGFVGTAESEINILGIQMNYRF